MTPRERLVDTIAEYTGQHVVEAGWVLDALLAHRDLLLEALGGERLEHFVQRELVAVLWRFPVSEEAQK